MSEHTNNLKELTGYTLIRGVGKSVSDVSFRTFKDFKDALDTYGVKHVLLSEDYLSPEELHVTQEELDEAINSHKYTIYGTPEVLSALFTVVDNPLDTMNRSIDEYLLGEDLNLGEPVKIVYLFIHNGVKYTYELINNPAVVYYIQNIGTIFSLYLKNLIESNRGLLMELQVETQKQQLEERLAEMDGKYNIYKGSVDRLTKYIHGDNKFKAKKNQELRSDYLLNLVREDYEDLLPLFFKANQFTGPNSQSVLITNYGRQYIDGLYEEVKQGVKQGDNTLD